MKVPADFPQVLALIAMLQRLGAALDILGSLQDTVVKEAASLKQPITSGISAVGSSQCDLLKEILRQKYENIKGFKEPDVENITLNYISSEYRAEVPLHSAADVLPRAFVFNPQTKLYIFLHGFTDNPDKDNFQNMNNALQETGNCNILALDASSLIGWFYLRSSTYVRFIGAALGKVLAKLYYDGGLRVENIHLIGHSLGAHIAAFASKEFLRITGLRVGRLTGLDTAGPCFAELDPSVRFNKSDATYVEAIHTNGGVLGMEDAVAQADFFPNGGKQQPKCLQESCNHSFAVKIFAESVRTPHSFVAVRCEDYEEFRKGKCSNEISVMGMGARAGTVGQFYLQTNGEQPYGRGAQGSVYQNNDGVVENLKNFGHDLFTG